MELFAELGAELGLPAPSRDAARASLDKALMRTKFMSHIGPNGTAHFAEVRSEGELAEFAQRIGFPVIIKPCNLWSSLFITLNSSLEELCASYGAMTAALPGYYAQCPGKDKTIAIQIEEFMSGSNHSIDVLINDEGLIFPTPIVDVLTGRDIGIPDFHHFARTTPTQLNSDEVRRSIALAQDAVAALGLRNTVAHVEFVFTPTGPRLLEVGGRPGGNRTRILELSFGIELVYQFYRLLQGLVPDVEPRFTKTLAIVTPFASKNGMLTEIGDLSSLKSLPGFQYLEVRKEPGARVGLARDGFSAPLYLELSGSAARDMHDAVARIAGSTDLYTVSSTNSSD